MYVTPEQIQAANKANVETILAVANAQFAALEKLANLQAGAMKSAFEDSIANTRALLSAKDIATVKGLQSDRGLTVLMADQSILQAIAIAERSYILTHGRIAREFDREHASASAEEIRSALLGSAA